MITLSNELNGWLMEIKTTVCSLEYNPVTMQAIIKLHEVFILSYITLSILSIKLCKAKKLKVTNV